MKRRPLASAWTLWLLATILLALADCAAPRYRWVDVESTPYDVPVKDLTRRLCLEAGRVWTWDGKCEVTK